MPLKSMGIVHMIGLNDCRAAIITPAQIIGRILDEVRAFANGCSYRDDVTLVVVCVNDEAALDHGNFS